MSTIYKESTNESIVKNSLERTKINFEKMKKNNNALEEFRENFHQIQLKKYENLMKRTKISSYFEKKMNKNIKEDGNLS